MIRTIYLDSKLDKQLRALKRAGKKAALAAKQAQDIICELKAGGPAVVETGAITKHGEMRINGCVKYDLGGGYRLVTIKQGEDLLLRYAGSHDDCHRWIENNRELSVDVIRRRSRAIPVGNGHGDKICETSQNKMMDVEGVEDIYDEIKDHQLRSIFRGLIESVKAQK